LAAAPSPVADVPTGPVKRAMIYKLGLPERVIYLFYL
jgi:hypothetical protein